MAQTPAITEPEAGQQTSMAMAFDFETRMRWRGPGQESISCLLYLAVDSTLHAAGAGQRLNLVRHLEYPRTALPA